ncbi:hypothetical protein [Viridibacterium curvum]|uniref:Uncharacterized protein n=1 Tax=Viridibacterium curvum TaxID=1101404 RepID=A0ABP9R797_9RHOO
MAKSMIEPLTDDDESLGWQPLSFNWAAERNSNGLPLQTSLRGVSGGERFEGCYVLTGKSEHRDISGKRFWLLHLRDRTAQMLFLARSGRCELPREIQEGDVIYIEARAHNLGKQVIADLISIGLAK